MGGNTHADESKPGIAKEAQPTELSKVEARIDHLMTQEANLPVTVRSEDRAFPIKTSIDIRIGGLYQFMMAAGDLMDELEQALMKLEELKAPNKETDPTSEPDGADEEML